MDTVVSKELVRRKHNLFLTIKKELTGTQYSKLLKSMGTKNLMH